MMALMVIVGIKPALALSGFATPPYWILLSVLFYGFAMKKTRLADRISYYILSLFRNLCRHPERILRDWTRSGARRAIHDRAHGNHDTDRVGPRPIVRIAEPQQGFGSHYPDHGGNGRLAGLAFLYGSLDGPVVAAAFAANICRFRG